MTSTTLTIGLVVNMPDAALAATERQFTELLWASAGHFDIRFRLCSLPGVPRSDQAREHMRGRYIELEQLMNAGVDALIVTGAEPRTPDLEREPYYGELARLTNWAQHNTVSTLWSCLAAHAAVLHLDGIRRKPLPAKLSGVFECEPVNADRLLLNIATPLTVPHSRQNGLCERDLAAHGYRVLTRSDAAGVDMFTREGDSLFVFLQGHPEYGPETLGREYLRDVGRYLRGERLAAPAPPHAYFDAETEWSLAHLTALADCHRGAGRMSRFIDTVTSAMPTYGWRLGAERLYTNWLTEVAVRRAGRAARSRLAKAAGA
jgi:homoserine O-succinyltransferase